MQPPDPEIRFPNPADKSTVFLRNVLNNPFIEVGDFTYYNDPEGPELFEQRCFLHHYEPHGDRLIIGRFCALAAGRVTAQRTNAVFVDLRLLKFPRVSI